MLATIDLQYPKNFFCDNFFCIMIRSVIDVLCFSDFRESQCYLFFHYGRIDSRKQGISKSLFRASEVPCAAPQQTCRFIRTYFKVDWSEYFGYDVTYKETLKEDFELNMFYVQHVKIFNHSLSTDDMIFHRTSLLYILL